MDNSSGSLCQKISLLLTFVTVLKIFFILRNCEKYFINDKIYPLPNSHILTYNSTITPKEIEHSDLTKIRRLPQGYSKLDIVNTILPHPKKYVQSSHPIKKRRLPQAIIIGVMKCGTGALLQMMDMHSKFVYPDREINFFGEEYNRGLKWYQRQMPYSFLDQITVEKSPSYFQISNLSVPLRIKSMNSSIRLILIVRDPITRTISNFVHNKKKGRYKNLSFEEVAFPLPRKAKLDSWPSVIIKNSLYELALKLYLEVFSPEQILVVDGDKLIKNPFPIIKKVEKYLNLKPEIKKDNLYFDKKKGFYCMKNNGTKHCLARSKGRKHPKVDKDTLKRLQVFFAPFNQRFYHLVGHDFGWETS